MRRVRTAIWAEIRLRLRRPCVLLPLGAAILGTIAWSALAATDRSSPGAGMCFPAVIMPAGTGAMWLLAGACWLLAPGPIRTEVRCGRCGCELRQLESADSRCPECGAAGAATTAPRTLVRIFAQTPGVVSLLIGTLVLAVALLFWKLIGGGAFDA